MSRCEKCNRNFETEKQLKTHFRKSNAHGLILPPKNCDICGETFSCDSNMRRHKKMMHDTVMLTCDLCGKMANKFYMDLHQKTHNPAVDERLHKCSDCDKAFRENFMLVDHIRKHHSAEQEFQCDQCGRAFARRKELLIHCRVSHPEVVQQYVCYICGFNTASKQGLVAHLKKCRSLPNTLHKTPIANPNLFEKIFACRYCPRKCTTTARVEEHEEQHRQDKLTFICQFCSEAFPRSDVLKSHETAIHTKNFENFCTICGKGFNSQGQVNQHMKFHTKDETAKECPFCGKKEVKMQRHIDVYHKNKRYRCLVCFEEGELKEMRNRITFFNHMRKNHPNEFEAPGFDDRHCMIMDEIEIVDE